MDNQKFIGKIVSFDENAKTLKAIVLHFDKANENLWMAKSGSLDAFLVRLQEAKKKVSACYQHDDRVLIGSWSDFETKDGAFSATLTLSNIPFVNDVVIPQLKDGTLQGASPSIIPLNDKYNKDLFIWEVIEGAISEISLVGLPADLNANIIEMRAKIELQEKNKNDFEIELLTL